MVFGITVGMITTITGFPQASLFHHFGLLYPGALHADLSLGSVGQLLPWAERLDA